jgi:hypothetical protein
VPGVHRTSRLIKLAVCLALVVVATSTAAEAAGTSGAVLTNVEYQQLVKIGKDMKSAASGRHGAVKAAIPVCRRALGVSPLIRASKARCTALMYYLISALNIESAARRCGSQKTADDALTCLTPSFTSFSDNSETLLLSVRRVDQLGTARKFKGNCVAALAGPKKWVALLGKFQSDLSVVLASMKAENLGLFNVSIKRVDGLESSIKSLHSAPISSCPHL